MNRMRTVEESLFELLRIGLGVQEEMTCVLTAEEWKLVFEAARKQSVLGVAYAGICRLPESVRPEEVLLMTWTGIATKISRMNEKVNKQSAFVQQKMEEAGRRCYIMKGQGNAALYGDLGLMRQSGDIDVFVEGGFSEVMQYVCSLCKPKEWNELEIHFPAFSDTEVEMHFRPFIMKNLLKNVRLQRFFAEGAEENFSHKVKLPGCEGVIATPTLTFNLVHQMVHVYHHLFTEGVGLRQLMDYFFLLKSIGREDDLQTAIAAVEELGLTRFAGALLWVLEHVFGVLPEGVKRLSWRPSERDGRLMLAEVVEQGNFGKLSDSNILKTARPWRPFVKIRRSMKLSRFGRGMWIWAPVSAVYWRLWKYCVAQPQVKSFLVK